SRAFNEYTANWPSFVATGKQMGWPVDLEGLLIRGRHAFEDFRYSHETSDSVWGLKGLILIIQSRILSRNPEWEGASLRTYFDSLNPHAAPVKEKDKPL
ncbi:MAG: hypothetical protein ABI925_09680, partial [Verrucomicrobiota bacterium]